MPNTTTKKDISQEITTEKFPIGPTEPFDRSIGTTEPKGKLSLIIKQIKFSLPVDVKENFVSFVAKKHNGNVSNYQNVEVIEALKYYVQSWLEVGEKPIMGNFSLSSDTLPSSVYLGKLTIISKSARLQEILYPDKFTNEGLKEIVKNALPLADRKTILKYHDLFKGLVDALPSDGLTQLYNVSRFHDTLNRISKSHDSIERARIWRNQLGYKFALRTKSTNPEFLNDVECPKIHARISESLKKQLLTIMSEKYNGKLRQVWSYELTNAIKDYMVWADS